MTHTLKEQLTYLKNHILSLPYAERQSANELLRRWQKVQRLSQLEQLRVDYFIREINRVHESRHRASTLQRE